MKIRHSVQGGTTGTDTTATAVTLFATSLPKNEKKASRIMTIEDSKGLTNYIRQLYTPYQI